MIDSSRSNSGFTFVEIAMVMIIIGLLIGGIFGGMKLKENAQTMDIIKQLNLYESSAIKFKELYGELPGDIRDPQARLNNCNAVPCNRAGDGDGVVSSTLWYNTAGLSTVQVGEIFTFWNHLLAAGFISGIRGLDDLNFGQGQPGFDIGGGLLIVPPWFQNGGIVIPGMRFMTSRWPNIVVGGVGGVNYLPCQIVENIDRKLDDGLPFGAGPNGVGGKIYIDNTFNGCWDGVHPANQNKIYTILNNNTGGFYYRTKIF